MRRIISNDYEMIKYRGGGLDFFCVVFNAKENKSNSIDEEK
jgi:hypothetical protein